MSSEAASSTSQVDSSEKEEVIKKAVDLIAQGKRNMVCNEVPKAVTLFEQAVKLSVDCCGELSRDCADPYYHYGCALLELGRMENTVLGAALEGVEVAEEKEEGSSDQFEKPPADDEDEEETAEEETAEEDEGVEPGESSQDDEHKGDDIGNFQLAWEYLDLAKIIYNKSDSKDDQLKAAECHAKLGEISMETEQHETAAEDLESALKIQQNHLAKDDRLIAETHYTLGLAYGLGKDFVSSIKHYQSAVSVIEARVASLTKFVEDREINAENKENKEEDVLEKHKSEIKDLRELIPEMKEKIEDTKIEQKGMARLKEMAKEMLGFGSSSSITTVGFGSSSSKAMDAEAGGSGSSGSATTASGDAKEQPKASDIGAHLIRKKRKPEDEVVTEIVAKKVCKDNEKDSSASSTETMNGHAEVKEVSS